MWLVNFVSLKPSNDQIIDNGQTIGPVKMETQCVGVLHSILSRHTFAMCQLHIMITQSGVD